jgi:hypothetical protein
MVSVFASSVVIHELEYRSGQTKEYQIGICCFFDNERVSELLLLNANSPIFQLFHGENKLIFNEMRMRDALYSTNMLSWIFIVLAH